MLEILQYTMACLNSTQSCKYQAGVFIARADDEKGIPRVIGLTLSERASDIERKSNVSSCISVTSIDVVISYTIRHCVSEQNNQRQKMQKYKTLYFKTINFKCKIRNRSLFSFQIDRSYCFLKR